MYIMLRASPRQLAAICSLLTTGYIVICISGIVTRVYVLLGRVTTHGGSHHHRASQCSHYTLRSHQKDAAAGLKKQGEMAG